MARAIAPLRDRVDPAWASFNFEKIPPDRDDSVPEALGRAITPPFGAGDRLVWLVDTVLAQRCPEAWQTELERTLPQIPANTILLFSSRTKPDGRLKSTKLLQKNAEIREFPLLAAWKIEDLLRQVKQAAQDVGVALEPAAAELLAEAVGNQTRQLYIELEKLKLYVTSQGADRPQRGSSLPLVTAADVAALVSVSTQTSFELAKVIFAGDTARALGLIADLLGRNENALVIQSILVREVRSRLWIKLAIDRGDRDDQALAKAIELRNPKQLFFLKKEVQPLAIEALAEALRLLLAQEVALKRGADPLETLQIKAIELCQLFARGRSSSAQRPR